MIGDLWVLVTWMEDPRRDGVPVTEPQLLALTSPADTSVDVTADVTTDAGRGRSGSGRPDISRAASLSPRNRDDDEDDEAGEAAKADGPDGRGGRGRRAGSETGAPQVNGLIPVDRVEWDAWRAAAERYLAALQEASAALAAAERRAGRAASRLLPGARRRATLAAEAACSLAVTDYAARLRAATTAYWPIHCEIVRRLESQAAARRWLDIRSRFADDGAEPVWGWSLRELEPAGSAGLVELTVFRWDSRPETPASAADFVSPDRFGARDLDRELLRLRAAWTVRRIVWDEAARRRVEQDTDGIPFALWWRAVTARVDADEKVVPPRSAQPFTAPPAPRGARRIEVLQLPEQIPDQLPEQGDGL
ncbi:hypothetical protein [Streptacidiphilus fuscans]|uniref:Uncharacterized protein n=1 Tax=Streptacidiphilus fuscans TaxID=2789292 RepID=A0A931FG47_9ACTN|nr:hypothetical protein [Streptacidiphilus fuscans]MBF9070521.1 hypothetical protein [Streptacidiphilus fuscans]